MTPMQKAKAKMLFKHVFFATLVLSTEIREEKSIPTAGTDMKKIYYNPQFIEGLKSQEEVMFVLAHEVMHIVFKHGLRRQGRNMTLWNIACDYAINWILKEEGFTPIETCCLDQRFANMSAEEIYDLLLEDAQKNGSGASSHDPGAMGGDLQEPENMDQEEQARTEREIMQKVAQASNMARMAGKLSANLERLVNGILEPKVPWRDYLRDYMTATTCDDESWNRRNRRFADAFLPSRHSEAMGEIVVIADTSGSISDDNIEQVVAEVRSIAETLKPERIRMVWADAVVCGEQIFEQGEPIEARPQGGGGTDMRVPLEHVEAYEPIVVIMITDGYTPWPASEPPFPLIVVCTTTAAVPIGREIRM